jgi:ribose transport system substrate-binding protein
MSSNSRSFVALVAMALLALGACGDEGGESDSAAGEKEEPLHVILVMPSLENEAFVGDVAGAEAAAEDLGVDLEVMAGSSFSDFDETIANIEAAVVKRPDVLILGAPTPETERAVAEANEEIPVVLLGGAENYADYSVANVTQSNLEGGRVGGELLSDVVEDGDKVGILTCAPGEPTIEQRIDGMEETLADDVNFVAELDAKCDNSQGRTVMTDMLSAHPDLAAVYSVSDSQTLGALRAIEAAGSEAKVVSFDGQSLIVKAIADGRMYATVGYLFPEFGRAAVELAVENARDEGEFPREVAIEPVPVTAENAEDFLSRI